MSIFGEYKELTVKDIPQRTRASSVEYDKIIKDFASNPNKKIGELPIQTKKPSALSVILALRNKANKYNEDNPASHFTIKVMGKEKENKVLLLKIERPSKDASSKKAKVID